MDRIEDELRATLADDRLGLPVRPDASRLIHAGVRRRRRNRAIASVSAVVVLVAGGAAAAALGSGGGGTDRVVPPTDNGSPVNKPPLPAPTTDEVPWAPAAYDYHHPPAFPGAVADPAVPWCRPGQLSLMPTQFQGAGGTWSGPLTVTNTSPAACALQGQPLVSMLAANGRTLVSSHPEPFYVDAWVRVAPGRTASAVVQWWPQFCNLSAPATVSVRLPHNGGTLSTAMHGSPRCDVDTVVPMAGRLDSDGFVANLDGPFTPLAGLQAQLDKVPTTAPPGGVVTYRLQLQNLAASDVRLDPCLPYRERLVNHATQHVLFEEDHLLNCPSAPATIAAAPSQRSTYFDLQIAVPTTAPAGDYDLIWQSVLRPVNAISEELIHIASAGPACHDGQVEASTGRAGAATGHYLQVIVFRNSGPSACTLYGYPGVQLLSKDGAVMTPAPKRGSDYMFPDPGPHTVLLASRGGTASFSVGGTDYDPVNQRPCPAATHMAVYAPGTKLRLLVPVGFPVCPSGEAISAVVAGSRGAG